MKIFTVIGARPQFIKAAIVSHIIRKRHNEILIHTGQHFDENMSKIFFQELNIPKPDYNLGISGGSHAEMTGKMLIEIERLLIIEKPDILLVYGDTNSTLAAALAASKLHIPICHVEAGVRTKCNTNPEEINRICTDHISSLLLTCTKLSQDNLQNEGLESRGVLVGDPMYDAFLNYRDIAFKMEHKLTLLSNGASCLIPKEYYYLTCHREENTINEFALNEILSSLNSLEAPTVYPVHPRNKKRALMICDDMKYSNIILAEPVGYLTSIFLVSNAIKVITDSGGLQREAFFSEKQCLTVLDFEVWPETIVNNRNQICHPNRVEILKKLSTEQIIDSDYHPFGNGDAGLKIVDNIDKFYKDKILIK